MEVGMQNGAESPLITAQRNAILQIRSRYERGELPFETFRTSLDAITAAQTPEECANILRDLPEQPAHLAALAALEPPALAPSVPAPMAPLAPRKRISAFMSETKKTRSAWTLAPNTHVSAMMGSVRLDMRRAQLPPEAYIKVNATMSEVVILVPDDVAIVVRSKVIMGEVAALGENVAGMIASGEEEHIPTHTAPRARLNIEVSALMGEVRVALVNTTNAAIADMARDAVRAALDGMRRGWENGGSLDAPLPRPGLPGYND
jgi:Cell wall-active antibiotics response LiaF, C-terminal